MRAVMQEFMFLLLAGNIEPVCLQKTGQKIAVSLSYEDFMSLRPQVGESSWRVTASRLQKQRLIAKTWGEGRVKFQLTRLGIETLIREFSLPGKPDRSDLWMLCILAPQEGQKPQHAAARRILASNEYLNVVPGLYMRPGEGYSGDLARELQLLGFVPCFVPVQPKQAQPASLDSLLYPQSHQATKKNRKIAQFGEDAYGLLIELQEKNTLHSKDKQRIGTFLISGLNHLHGLEPIQSLFQSPREEVEKLCRTLDGFMQRYLRQ